METTFEHLTNLCNSCQYGHKCAKDGIIARWMKCDHYKPVEPETTNSTEPDLKKGLKDLNEYCNQDASTSTTILDSGDRTRFETGAVRDMHAGKGRMDLLPWAAIMDVSKLCEAGAVKYGEHNVDKGIPTHSLCDSAARHLAKYLEGWTDENHLRAAAWNLLWAIQMELKHPEVVDTPYKEK